MSITIIFDEEYILGLPDHQTLFSTSADVIRALDVICALFITIADIGFFLLR
jgi:hypothetical protein